jgi:hypothetical protein
MANEMPGWMLYTNPLTLDIISATSGLSADNTNGTINVPSGAVAGDLLVALVSSDWSSAALTVTSTGQVWTQQVISTTGSSIGRSAISTTLVSSTLGAHTVTFLNSGDKVAMTVLVLRNANTSALTNTGFISNYTASNSTVITLTGVAATSYVFSTVVSYNRNTLHTPDGNTTEIVDQPDTSLAVGYATLRGTNRGQAAIGGSWATYTAGDPITGAAIEIRLA